LRHKAGTGNQQSARSRYDQGFHLGHSSFEADEQACATSAWPMFSSLMPLIAATASTLW
jgi:hypothetical protein